MVMKVGDFGNGLVMGVPCVLTLDYLSAMLPTTDQQRLRVTLMGT